MSAIVLISLIGLLGLIIGFILARIMVRSNRKKKERELKTQNEKNSENKNMSQTSDNE